MPGKRLLLMAVLGLTLTALGCCRACDRWCGPNQGCCAPPPSQCCQPQCCPNGSYYPAQQCPPGCAPVASNVTPLPPASGPQWTQPCAPCAR
jgi:hypothetical protein